MMARAFMVALIVVCGATAVARLSESAVRLWPVARWFANALWAAASGGLGAALGWLIETWLKRRAVKRRADIGMPFEPLKKLPRR